MTRFTIQSNPFLDQDIQAFCYTDFFGYGKPGNPDYLNILKNDNHQTWSDLQLNNAAKLVRNALNADLPQILELSQLKTLTVCVIPRSKAEAIYRAKQLLFKSNVETVVNQLAGFVDGANYISRHTNTKTTHLRKHIEGYVNDGQDPYPGIMNNTCHISNNVRGKDILLIDDIYTKNVNIDEDAIQALLDKVLDPCFFMQLLKRLENSFKTL